MTDEVLTTEAHPAAEAAAEVLQRLAPQAAALAVPYLDELFRAQDSGHSFIRVGSAAAEALRQAAPVVGDGSRPAPLVLQGQRLFSGRVFAWEQEAAQQLRRLAQAQAVPSDGPDTAGRLRQWFPGEGARGQQAAAALALLQGLMLITGGPGTGKTTTVARLLALLCGSGEELPRIALIAPTGKAAAHMTRALHGALQGFDAPEAVHRHLSALEGRTVHRLLRLHPLSGRAQFDAEQPLPYDIIVADEASMFDLPLLLKLLRAVPDGCRLILLGDENQLPPVGIGSVLPVLAQPTQILPAQAEWLAHRLPEQPFAVHAAPPPLAAHTAKLTRSHRFDPERGIGALAQAVVAGDAERAAAAFDGFPDELAWLPPSVPALAAAFAGQHADYWAAVDAGDAAACFAAQQERVVLAAQRADAEAFNREYVRLLTRCGRAAETGWFAGQVLMASENDYAVNVFNGDIGIVLPHEGTLAAFFPEGGGYRALPPNRLPRCETAFALTVHKSQGSEYGTVWLLPPAQAEGSALFDRTLLYTAVTRARRRFAYAGSTESLAAAVRRRVLRRSGLRRALARAFADG